MKADCRFAKLKSDQTLEYANVPLRIPIHHHSEWDEDVLDPETGEPTGETEHKTYDWDTYETKVRPTKEDFYGMGFYEVKDLGPQSAAPEGKRWQKTKKYAEAESDGVTVLSPVYELADIPLPTLQQYDDAMEQHLRNERKARGYTTREPDAYLTSAVPRWKQDAEDWVAHRDAVMEYALELINGVQSGQVQQPTMAEFKAGLPKISWTFGNEVE